MRRILVFSCLAYMSVAIVIAIHAIIIENDGKQDNDVISHEILDRAFRWPIRIFE